LRLIGIGEFSANSVPITFLPHKHWELEHGLGFLTQEVLAWNSPHTEAQEMTFLFIYRGWTE
jgi:hypothetical protein